MSTESAQPALTVAIPGHRSLHVGPFSFAQTRDAWVSSLRAQMHNTAHVPGTTVEPADYIPVSADLVHLDPASLIPEAETIAEFLRHENDNTDPAANFPDTFTVLVAAFGSDKAIPLYRRAGRLIDEELEAKALPGEQKVSADELVAELGFARVAIERAGVHLAAIVGRERGRIDCDLSSVDATDMRHHLAAMDASARALTRIIVPYRDKLGG